jgi:hypothetical protein
LAVRGKTVKNFPLSKAAAASTLPANRNPHKEVQRMNRKTILVEAMGAPKRIVQEIQTRPRTTTICPLCRRRFKKNDPTVLIDLVKSIPLTPETNKLERSVRIQICEPCAQPVFDHRHKVMDDLIKLLAELVVEDMLEEDERDVKKRFAPEGGRRSVEKT